MIDALIDNKEVTTSGIKINKVSSDPSLVLMYKGKASDISNLFTRRQLGRNEDKFISQGLVSTKEMRPQDADDDYRPLSHVVAELLELPLAAVKSYYAEQFLRGQVTVEQVVCKHTLRHCLRLGVA